MTTAELNARCTLRLHGHPAQAPGAWFQRMATWTQKANQSPDRYGGGALINGFEAQVAQLLGKQAAVFMPSGTMAQQIAMRIWCDRAGIPHFGMHPTCHLELHEQRGYSHLHGLRATLLGAGQRPLLAPDLMTCTEQLAAIIAELPARELGGQLPTWDQLEALKTAARARKTPLHLDGARLWETRTFYEGRSYNAICSGFESVYVSFYKGIGGLGGALLAGDEDFVREARVWQRRQGGNLFNLHPFVVSAAMNLEHNLERMPHWLKRAQALSAVFNHVDGACTVPAKPHVNLFHVLVNTTPAAAANARNVVAEEMGLWIASGFLPTDVPGWSRFEIYVADNAMALQDGQLSAAMRRFMQVARAR